MYFGIYEIFTTRLRELLFLEPETWECATLLRSDTQSIYTIWYRPLAQYIGSGRQWINILSIQSMWIAGKLLGTKWYCNRVVRSRRVTIVLKLPAVRRTQPTIIWSLSVSLSVFLYFLPSVSLFFSLSLSSLFMLSVCISY